MRHLPLQLLLLAVAACGGAKPRPNVVLVIIDTVRADRLGCYGNPRGLTPYVDAFAAQGLRFAHAASHAPWTLPSIASLLTSLHPAEHGAGGGLRNLVPQFRTLEPGVTTLAGVLRERGWRTHAIANVAFLDEWTGVLRDFASADVDAPETNTEMRSAERTTDAALAWLDAHGREGPFFLLVHYFDPHAVYAPPQPFRERFAGPLDQGDETWVFGTRMQMMALRSGTLDLDPKVIRRAEKLYDGEIAYLDSQLGRFFDGLDQRGLAGDSIVVLTSDHGEEFLDHGGFEHGHTLYDELTHVPLLLRFPGRLVPGVVEPRVAHVDVAPTICELADVAPPQQFVGHSLLDYVRDPTTPPRDVLAHGNMWTSPLTSWKSGDEKLIVRPDGSCELYDLAQDPAETTDLSAVEPDQVAALRSELDAVLRKMDSRRRGTPAGPLPPDVFRRLQENGYMGGEEGDAPPPGDGAGGGER